MMSDKKRKRGRPRVAPVLSYGSEFKMRNNITRTIKKPRYLRELDEEDNISNSKGNSFPDNFNMHSRGSLNGSRNRNARGYNTEIDDKDSEYHYGSDFEDEESELEKTNTGVDSRSISEVASDLEDSDIDDFNLGLGEGGVPEGVEPGTQTEGSANFMPFWKLGPAGTLGFRPHTPIPVWLQDREYPELALPSSSDDLLMPQMCVLQAVGIYEVLRHFKSIARLSPFHFEDFCASLLVEEQNLLLSEIHIALLKALIREEDSQQTHFAQLDQKDSVNIALYFVDSIVWAETLRNYLQSDPDFKPTLQILNSCNYPFTSLSNRLKVLQFLCDQFLQTTVVRDDLLSEGKIHYDDHCRACHKTGDLLCCDSCPAVYHLDCADPPLSNAPLEIEDWTCNVCNKHKLKGVTDCFSLMETSGLMCRQEPLGYDRHGRKYWFLVRRIIVESEEGDVWYYSTLEQLDLLLLLMDSEDLEEALYLALKEFGDDIRRQMEITEKLTEKASGLRKAAIMSETEETRKKIEKIQAKKEKLKTEGESFSKIMEEVKDKVPEGGGDQGIKLEKEEEKEAPSVGGSEEKREGLPEGKVEDLKEEIKEDSKDDIKDILGACASSPLKKEKKAKAVWDEALLQSLVEKKLEQLKCVDGYYRLGCDYNFRNYCNQYVTNSLALNKLQHNEERDKKRHLSHKFSLTNNSEFKWNGQCYGTKETLVVTVRQTLISLEQNLSSHFFHPNWQHVRKVWNQFVMAATLPHQFAKSLLWLVSCIKPVVFNTVWHESLGHLRLKRITALDREERKKQEKREKKEADEEARLFPFVKFTKGVKHQLWKTKGEEYRIHGLWGWQWVSCCKKTQHIPMDTVGLRAGPEKITIPIKSNGGLVRGLPINTQSYRKLVAKNPSMQFSLLSPKQKSEEGAAEGDKEKRKEVTLSNSGQLEVSAINLEDYFEDGVVNVSNELKSRLRLVYPKLCKPSSLDNLLEWRMSLKDQEEKDMTKTKQMGKDAKAETIAEVPIDVENDSDSSSCESTSEDENIDEIPDSQRRIAIHKQRPAGHLLKEMRLHKLKYEALDKADESLPCYSISCRESGRSSCYSPSCIFKERTKQKLINSVNNYKIITNKPAPFDVVGSQSPIRLREPEKPGKSESSNDISKPATTINGQVISSSPAPPFEIAKKMDGSQKLKNLSGSEFKLAFEEDSCTSQSSVTSDLLVGSKSERVFSSENCSGKVCLKKLSGEAKKSKKHKIPPINYFRTHKKIKVDSEHEESKILHSLFILPSWELRVLARKGGKYSSSGFNPNAKINHHFWPYPCARPVFKITWLYRTMLINTLNAVAYQLRILWACLRWDDMHEKGPLDGRKQVTTDLEIIQTEILKRKISGRFNEKTEYLRRKVTIPLDVPKPVREFTPSQRSGLRKRRRAQSPVNKQPESTEEWVEEEKLDLWEVRYFGERLEKAALSKKAGIIDKDSTFSTISRSTSPSEFKAKIEEQLKIQRATFNQKKSMEGPTFSSNKGIVKVAIGSAIPGATGSKLTFSNAKLMQGGSSIVTVGSKLPTTALTGRKIVTTKGGKIITVQTAGGLQSNNQAEKTTKISLGKSSVFPVSSLPKVQVTQQGNKVIKLQNISGATGQRAILPRVSSSLSSPTSIIRPITTSTPVSTAQVFQTSTPTALPTIRPTSGQQIQILQMPDGQLQVKGLQEGQQLVQRGDGKLQLVNTKLPISSISPVSQTPIQVAQQSKTFTTAKDATPRAVAALSGNQIVKINGQQVILRTGGANAKQILSVNAKDAALSPVESKVLPSLNAPKFKMVKATDGFALKTPSPAVVPSNAAVTSLKEKQPNVEEVPKTALTPSTPSSPAKVNSATSNTMTLRVQVRMTEQGPKTIIQGLQPGVGLTKDHIMAIQQQVRTMLSECNLQVNELSPLMTLTLHVTSKNQQQQTPKTSSPQLPSDQISPTKAIQDQKDSPMESNRDLPSKETPQNLLDNKDFLSEAKENSEIIKTALNKKDSSPDMEQKLADIQKINNRTKKDGLSPRDHPSLPTKGNKRQRDQDELDWESESSLPKSKAKKVKSEKAKNKKDPSSLTPLVTSKTQIQDARKKLLRQQKLEALLTKQKDQLKKDILKKRALLEKELQLQIHKELAVARQQIQILEKIKSPEPVTSSTKKAKHESPSIAQEPVVATRDTSSKTRKSDTVSSLKTSGSSGSKAKISMAKNKRSSKTKSKKVVCICRTFFDDTKFYVGCDLCGNWFHGDCVGITEALSRSMTEYVCDDCANAKLNKDLFCFCRQPYDETQFYICCEKCEDWYHGKCIGIMQAEADDIDDYICPKCDPDNQWNRPCQKKLTNKDYIELKKLSKLLIQHKNAWPFLEPVDQSEVPDYYKVVKVPMDFKIVEKKVAQHKYNSLYEFVGDVMLVFDNCRAYNPPNSSFCSCANTVELFFCTKLKQLKQKVSQRT